MTIGSLLWIVLLTGGSCRGSIEPTAPNVVLLIVDTLRADKLGCYGHPANPSPELDALAADGILFEQVIAPTSWTRPSIGALLTGRYPRTLGIFHEVNGILQDRFTTLAEIFDEQGYTTIGITANPHLNSSFNFDQGFDRYFDSAVVYSFMEMDRHETTFRASVVSSAVEMFEIALGAIESSERGPFYLQLDLMEVHEWYRGDHSLTRAPFDGQFLDRPDATYLQAIRQTSHDIQRFVDELRARPGWSDTLFVITSDHGEGLDDHPSVAQSRYHGRLLYESHLRVPLILYRPGATAAAAAGRRITRPVRLLDVMPTVLDSVGLDVPDGLDGLSLGPLMRDSPSPVLLPEFFVAETEIWDVDKAAVYAEDWKYIENYKKHRGVADREMHAIGATEDGVLTNRLGAQRQLAQAMADYLKRWKQDHPRARPELRSDELSAEEYEQLKAIGYIDGPSP